MSDVEKQLVFLVDNEAEVGQVLRRALQQTNVDIRYFDYAADCLRCLISQICDLLITDLTIPDMTGIELLKRVKAMAPHIPVLILSDCGDIPTAVEAIKAGANDFIEKPLDKKGFVSKVKSLMPENGNHKPLNKTLTQTEEKVLKLVLDGKSNREIADLLNRSQRTIEVHRAHIKHKLGADSLVDLVKRAVQMGLIDF